jgi:DNA-binding SARP family transcriptional activator
VLWRPGASYTFDVADFEAAVVAGSLPAAAALYRGDLLPGCYDDWIILERERLQQLFVETLEQLVRQLEAGGDYPAAIGYARRRLRCDPLHEAAYCQLMRLYALNGDRARVMHTFQACAAMLKGELDLSPSLQTCQIYAHCLKMRSSASEVTEPAQWLHPTGALDNMALPLTTRPAAASA